MWKGGALGPLLAPHPRGCREGDGRAWGEGLRDKPNKNSIQSGTFEHAGAAPPRFLRRAAWALPAAPLCGLQHCSPPSGESGASFGPGIHFLEPSAGFAVADQVQGTQRRVCVRKIRTWRSRFPPGLGSVPVSLKQDPHLGTAPSSRGLGIGQGPPDGSAQQLQACSALHSWTIHQHPSSRSLPRS